MRRLWYGSSILLLLIFAVQAYALSSEVNVRRAQPAVKAVFDPIPSQGPVSQETLKRLAREHHRRLSPAGFASTESIMVCEYCGCGKVDHYFWCTMPTSALPDCFQHPFTACKFTVEINW